jgi:Holliday junction resolvase RusA-like endonuclease
MPWTASDPIRIVVPGTPKSLRRNNHRLVKTRDGREFVTSYMPADTRNNQAVIKDMAMKAMGNNPPWEGPIDLRIVAYMPVPASWSQKKQCAALADQLRPTGSPDASNLQKQIEDSLAKVVYRNDSQITDPAGPWKRFSDRPRLVIEIRQLTWTA